MTDTQLQLLHEHYRDSCSVAQGIRGSRDRYFYSILAVLTLVLFNIYSPADYSAIVSEAFAKRLDVARAPDLGYLRSVVWVLLLGLTIRYCQAVLHLERVYNYLHSLEAELARELGQVFGREGRAYLADYPAFLNWAHRLYTVLFPILLVVVVVAAAVAETASRPWPWLVYFDLGIAAILCVLVGLYLHARHRRAANSHDGGGRLQSRAPAEVRAAQQKHPADAAEPRR